jgi:hypothetical protein
MTQAGRYGGQRSWPRTTAGAHLWRAGPKKARRGRRLAAFNWDDREAPIAIPRGLNLPSKGIHVWTGKRIGVGESAAMAPRSGYLLNV